MPAILTPREMRTKPAQTTTRGETMARKYFGTDGIRGLANSLHMTSEVALKVGMAAGKLFSNGARRHRS